VLITTSALLYPHHLVHPTPPPPLVTINIFFVEENLASLGKYFEKEELF